MPPRRANAIGAGSAETPEAGSEFVNESPDRAGWPRRPPRKARRRVIAGGYGEEGQRRAAGCIGRPATGGDSFTASARGEVEGRPRSARRDGRARRLRRALPVWLGVRVGSEQHGGDGRVDGGRRGAGELPRPGR